MWLREEQPALDHNDKQTRQRGPQADEQQQAGTYLKSDDLRCCNVDLVGEATDSLETKSGSGDHSHDQKSRAGYTRGECPKETSQGARSQRTDVEE